MPIINTIRCDNVHSGVVPTGTKAETLAELAGRGFPVPPMMYITVQEWRTSPVAAVKKIQQTPFGKNAGLAIRSSAKNEDGIEYSQAGAYDSILNVPAHDTTAIHNAITRIIQQFDEPDDQILVQKFVTDTIMSGVVTTRALADGSPYYVVNYDDTSGRTDTVTSGKGAVKAVSVYRGAKSSYFDSHRLRSVMDLVQKLESYFDGAPLDIEFAVDEAYALHLLQVRLICSRRHWKAEHEQEVHTHIPYMAHFVGECMTPKIGLSGQKTMLGNMPDWNPAEMIGTSPRPLAFSLYRELITRRVWSLAREEMGYRKLPPAELMLSLCGRPYIDIRASFNSFLPDALPETTAEKLVNAWLQRLDAKPNLHDKVEFEVVHTMADLGVKRSIRERYPDLLSPTELGEYAARLRKLTANAIRKDGSLYAASKHIETLRILQEKSLQAERAAADAMTVTDIALRIANAMENCRTLGTFPFAIIARHGFIAEALLKSAVRNGALESDRVAAFKRSVQTISGTLARDFHAVLSGKMPKTEFLQSYGHLRPGTYDILSPAYKDRHELFDVAVNTDPHPETPTPFVLTGQETIALNFLLQEEELNANAEEILEYAASAIAGREYAKFVFTRHVSHILELLAAWGNKLSLTPESISMLPVNELLESLHKPFTAEASGYFAERIAICRKEYERGRTFILPYLIRSERDLYIVPQHRSAPNFITRKRVTAPVQILDNRTTMNEELQNRIVCIDSADPGYDWIFTRGIAGLVTCYGGANSHMAIRCAEYDLPAAIGCGELLFDTMRNATVCTLDCAENTVTPVTNGHAEIPL